MSALHPMTFVFILIIAYCAGWLSALWFFSWLRKSNERRKA